MGRRSYRPEEIIKISRGMILGLNLLSFSFQPWLSFWVSSSNTECYQANLNREQA